MNQWLENHRTLVLSVIGILLVGGLAMMLIRWQPAAPITIEAPRPTAMPVPTETPGPIQVYVSGAVAQANVYSLPAGTIARDAIDAAGGVTADADLNRINLALPLEDGTHVHVPSIGDVPTLEPGVVATPTPPWPVNINTAPQADLETLPGIGPATAEKIIAYREAYGPFNTIEEIQNVSGIGPATFEDIKEIIVVE
ncbi:MAG: ComEA family DNA-binding protein [Anaerolineae bacterium]|nr:ComEA family DNA-binding protein [Anaerolineae bacterium]